MSLKIEKFTESRKTNAFYHKVADVPAGVSVKIAAYLSAGIIPEATPLYMAENGLYAAAASAKVVEAAAAGATTYAVAKGHLFMVGDKVQKTSTVAVNITAIDVTDPNKDVITVDATLGVKAEGEVLGQSLTGSPIAVTGEEIAFKPGDNVLVSAWVIAVVNKNIVPEPVVKPSGVMYV